MAKMHPGQNGGSLLLLHGAKFFNIEFRGVNFLSIMKTLNINTIKLVYS